MKKDKKRRIQERGYSTIAYSYYFGNIFSFSNEQTFFEEVLQLKTKESFENYITNELTHHIQQTIKALLIHEEN